MANFYKKSQIPNGGVQQEKSRQSGRGAQQKKSQSGRSMVEMLGVLAIIGVLSIGGIAGYSKAMRRHNVNATAEIFNDIIRSYASLRETATTGMQASHLYDTKDLVELGIYSGCKLVKSDPKISWSSSYACRTPIGQISTIAAIDRVNFVVLLSKDTCADFLAYNWHKVIPDDWANERSSDVGNSAEIMVNPDGDRQVIYHKFGTDLEDNYNMAGIAEACSRCESEDNCAIGFMYGGEI